MVNSVLFDIFGIFIFTSLLYIGIKFSKYKIKHIKFGGYLLIVIATLGLIFDMYSIMYNYVAPFLLKG